MPALPGKNASKPANLYFYSPFMFMKYHHLLILIISFVLSCNQKPKKTETLEQQEQENVLSKPSFTDTTACIFSEVVYCSDPQQQLNKYLPQWRVVWNPAGIGGNYALVATDGNAFVIAFRGSLISFSEDAFNNWIYHDLNVASQENWQCAASTKATVSTGSYIAWQNLEKMKDRVSGKTLWTYLSENMTDNKSLFLTGHSLGGNLATVYASYLSWKFEQTKH